MRENIRLLEDRVSLTVDRLRRLKAERDGLAEQVRRLSEKLELAEIRNAEHPAAAGGPQQERVEIVAALQQALSVLRESGPSESAS